MIQTMKGDNRLPVIDKPVELEKQLLEVKTSTKLSID
jgi:hypothetical protein